jgi:superkiller protein 3
VEELDLAACAHAEKLPLSTKEKSQVLTYKQAAQLLCEDKTSLNQAIRLDPQNALAHFLRARCSATNIEEAVNSYRKAIELKPEWKRYYVDVALLANGLESYKSSDEGLKIWQLSLESAPDDPRVYAGYASALRSRGKNAEAEAMLRRGMATNGSDADSAYGLCSMYVAQKNLVKLRPVCETAIAGLSGQALGTLGYELSEIKEYALAEAAYRKAVESGPDPGNVSESNLANTLLQEGKAREAAEIYRRRLARDPGDSSDREQYAAALEAEGDLKNAEAQYLQAAEHKDCETLSALGRFYLHQKKAQQAFEQFDRAFQEQWDCPTPVYFLTQEPQAFGAQQREIPQFEEKILARARPKPDEKVANTWYRFANLAHDFGHNEDAATAYRKAADLDSKQAFPLGGLGWALHDAGRYREAIAAFEEAEKRQPGYLKSSPEVQKRYEQSLAAVQGKKP